MNKLKTIVLAFLIIVNISYSQVISTNVNDYSVCGESITIPIIVDNCNNIAAISLVLDFNQQTLIYQGYQNLNNSLNQGLSIFNENGGKIYFSWFSMSAISPGNDTLFELVFNGIGYSELNWDTIVSGNCEYSTSNGDIIPAIFTDGSINLNQPTPPLLLYPLHEETGISIPVTFTWESNECISDFNFQISTDSLFTSPIIDTIITGNSLELSSGLAAQTTYFWRVGAIDTVTYWSVRREFITDFTTNNEILHNDYDNQFYCFPNPFESESVLRYYVSKPCTASIHIYSSNGISVYSKTLPHKTQGWQQHNIDQEIPQGIYLVTLILKYDIRFSRRSIIINKI